MFSVYLELGWNHILDIRGYDHILFVVALCALYLIKDWKKVIILGTAFTLGHSLTLALSSYNVVRINAELIELLIPITIMLTGLYNIIRGPQNRKRSDGLHYTMAAGFGLIHGMGFSNYFKALVGDESIVTQLLAFNIGVELGQIVVVLATLFMSYVVVNICKVPHKIWNYTLSSIAIIVSLYLIFQP